MSSLLEYLTRSLPGDGVAKLVEQAPGRLSHWDAH
jgi:hypothetical protein